MMILGFCILFVSAAFEASGSKVGAPVSESKLRQSIFQGYDKLVRPVQDVQDKITTEVGFTPVSITYFEHSVLGLEGWFIYKWNDGYLRWEPSGFNNISVLRVPSSEVWKPDIAVYTAASETRFFPQPQTNVLLYPNGDVLWVPPMSIASRCLVPDTQSSVTCNIKLGSWTFSENELDVKVYTEKVDLSTFQDVHPEWKLKDVQAGRQEKYYPCCVEAYPSIDFNVTLVRKDKLSHKNDVLSKYMYSG